MRAMSVAWLMVMGCARGPGGIPEHLRVVQEPATEPAPTPELRHDVPMPPDDHHPGLLQPTRATETAPDRFRVRFVTTRGPFVVEAHRDWAPLGTDRFYNLVKVGYYDKTAFFRVIDGFMAQFGISPYPSANEVWRSVPIPDDPVMSSNTRGRIAWAMSGPNTRTTQLFISYADTNTNLDDMGFAPFGEVVEGMHVVDALHRTGECAPRGPGPNQGRLQLEGDAYLDAAFPEVDRILRAEVLE